MTFRSFLSVFGLARLTSAPIPLVNHLHYRAGSVAYDAVNGHSSIKPRTGNDALPLHSGWAFEVMFNRNTLNSGSSYVIARLELFDIVFQHAPRISIYVGIVDADIGLGVDTKST